MTNQLNYFFNLLNLFLLFLYFIFLNIGLIKKEFEFLLVTLLSINLIIKFYKWYNNKITKKRNLDIVIGNLFYDERFIKFTIFVLSILIPIYMIVQKDSIIIDIFIEKLSFLLVFILSLVGFYLEFFILERKANK